MKKKKTCDFFARLSRFTVRDACGPRLRVGFFPGHDYFLNADVCVHVFVSLFIVLSFDEPAVGRKACLFLFTSLYSFIMTASFLFFFFFASTHKNKKPLLPSFLFLDGFSRQKTKKGKDNMIVPFSFTSCARFE